MRAGYVGLGITSAVLLPLVAASCQNPVFDRPPLSTTASTGTGGAGGAGGMASSSTSSGSTCGAAQACETVATCPEPATKCVKRACTAGCCDTTTEPSGTACDDSQGKLCDGDGKCVACLTKTDCPATNTMCATAKCSADGACTVENAAKGASCNEAPGVVCDGNGACVAAHCADGVANAGETDKDCGGTCAAKCDDGLKCMAAGDCKSGVCDPGLHTCTAPTCVDTVQNGDETDEDCGGPTCDAANALCATGKHCLMSADCQSACCDAGACVDTTSDPLNCGSCGHSCLGGDCTAGKCQPVLLQSGLTQNIGIAVNGSSTTSSTSLFMASGGKTLRCPLPKGCGGNPTDMDSTNANGAGALAADANNVYFNANGRIAKCPTTGCATPPTLLNMSGSIAGAEFGVDSTNVYGTAGVNITQCAIAGCASPTILATQPAGTTALDAVSDGNFVYWAGYVPDEFNAAVYKCAVGGSCGTSLTPVATGLNQPYELHVSGGVLYWHDAGSGWEIQSCPVGGCGAAPTVVVKKSAQCISVGGLAVDGQHVYWGCSGGNNAIMTCTIGNCASPTVLATNAAAPWDRTLLVDATAIYWLTSDGSAWMLAK